MRKHAHLTPIGLKVSIALDQARDFLVTNMMAWTQAMLELQVQWRETTHLKVLHRHNQDPIDTNSPKLSTNWIMIWQLVFTQIMWRPRPRHD